ncbi:rhodanese-like domain-containing protein [Crocinitomicaceae bacterium]|jgi:rhodanese-related sulfurtransferase|nr:rhodanese-like domain-containing protein [Crocinitomicaceae bacterium]MDB4682549.1 rhodanese-like domain-containing protein [Crocinitomicaceae bacterium]
MKTICPKECKDRIAKGENLEIIDIRELYEYDQCNIGSRHIPMSEIIDNYDDLDSKNQIVILCRSGRRAEAVANLIECETQLNDVWIVEGGIKAWKEKVDPSLNLE